MRQFKDRDRQVTSSPDTQHEQNLNLHLIHGKSTMKNGWVVGRLRERHPQDDRLTMNARPITTQSLNLNWKSTSIMKNNGSCFPQNNQTPKMAESRVSLIENLFIDLRTINNASSLWLGQQMYSWKETHRNVSTLTTDYAPKPRKLKSQLKSR